MYVIEKVYKKSKRVTTVNKCEKLEDAKAALKVCEQLDKTASHSYRIIQIIK